MTTEIQKIPGNFNLPTTWPKVEFPDITSSVLYDWHADDLKLGAFQPWVDRVSGLALTTFSSNFDLPNVISETNGHKAIVFEKRSKIRAAVGVLPHFMTLSLVVEPGSDNSGSARLISGQPGFKLVNMDTVGAKMVTNSTIESADKVRTTLGSATVGGLVANKKTNAVVRYEPGVSITAQLLGGVPVVGALQNVVSNTEDFLVGYNTLGTPSASLSEGFQGKISRITIWNRALSPVDIESVMFENKGTYKLPN